MSPTSPRAGFPPQGGRNSVFYSVIVSRRLSAAWQSRISFNGLLRSFHSLTMTCLSGVASSPSLSLQQACPEVIKRDRGMNLKCKVFALRWNSGRTGFLFLFKADINPLMLSLSKHVFLFSNSGVCPSSRRLSAAAIP